MHRLYTLSFVATFAAALFVTGCGSENPAGNIDAATSSDAGAPDANAAVGPAGLIEHTTKIDGVDRSYFLYVPESAVAAMASGPVPLLVGLHGAGSNGRFFFDQYGFRALADAHGAVLAMPDAYKTVWATSKEEGWPELDGQGNSLLNDMYLVGALVDEAQTSYRIDPKRLYACGVSRGGALTGILAAASNNPKALSGTYVSPFAAYAISAGYSPFDPSVDFKASSPRRPIWFIHGDKDEVVPYGGGKAFADSLQGADWPVTFTTVKDAGHAWLWQPKFGHDNEELWRFFSDNALP